MRPTHIDPDDLTELADADRLVERLDGAFIHSGGSWLRFHHHVWTADRSDLMALVEARAVANVTLAVARSRAMRDSEVDPEWRKRRLAEVSRYEVRSRQVAYAEKLVRYAGQHPTLRLDARLLDARPHLLATGSGVVDLRDGRLRAGRPADYLTRFTPVPFQQDAPRPLRWARFLTEVISDDPEELAYMQRLVGLTLTGETSPQRMWLILGSGANGKSRFLTLLERLLGAGSASPLSQAAPASLMLNGRHGGATPEIVRLAGRRLVTLSETSDEVTLNSALVKRLTGEDAVVGRGLYRDFEELTIQAKFLMATNRLPRITDTSEGMWRRLVVVPFDRTIPAASRDPKLGETLEAELPGILRWAVDGAVAFYRDGWLDEPERFRLQTHRYRGEQDLLAQFLVEGAVLEPGASVPAQDLQDAFYRHCDELGRPKPDWRIQVAPELRARGCEVRPTGHDRRKHWHGIRLRTPADLTSR
jgi:putative DNA primase/helicase